MTSERDWQEPDETAFDPGNPLALLQKALAASEDDRTMSAVWAVRSMIAAGADTGVMAVARDYVKRAKLLALGDFDRLAASARAGDDDDLREPGQKSAATVLVEMARELYIFGAGDTGEAYAVPQDGPQTVALLRGGKRSLRALLAREYFTSTGKAASQAALADALTVIEGFAQEEDPRRLYVRAADVDGSVLWLDLGDQSGRTVRVAADGWSVEDEAPVLFKRTALTAPLPEPARGGSIGDLWEWLNVTELDRPMVAAALVASLFSEQPHVVLAVYGGHGTGKTTATRILATLLDPSPVPVRKPPKDMDSWVTMAAGSWVVGLDNLSVIPGWLSDSICRASTGDGDVRRRLWSDGDLAVFAYRRCVIFNSIDVGALAPDLADRALVITLDPISDQARLDDQAFWSRWADAHPKLLGSVLDLAARVLRRLPGITLERNPRMINYARILAAVDAELRTDALGRYDRQAEDLAADSLTGSPLAVAITEVITVPFKGGGSGKLLELVTPSTEGWRPPKDWPASARAATGELRRLAPSFRKTGWGFDENARGQRDHLVTWNIFPPGGQGEAGRKHRPQRPQRPRDVSDQPEQGAGDAGDSLFDAGDAGDSAGERPWHAGDAGDAFFDAGDMTDDISAGQATYTGDTGDAGDVSGLPDSARRKEKTGAACPRHAPFGPHRDCPECRALAVPVTEPAGAHGRCVKCGGPLDPVMAAAGFTDHGED